MEKERLIHFDVIKLFTIFLVLWGHSIQYFLSSNHYDEPVYRIIYSFHMPLFMVISGYFSLSSISLSPYFFIKKKFVQLLLPVLSWVVLWGLIEFVINLVTGSNSFGEDIKVLFDNVKYGLIGPYPFWFLRTCFACYFLAYCGHSLRISKYLWMIITIIISQFIPGFEKLSLLYPCFIVGMELSDNPYFFDKIRKNYISLFICFIILLCFWTKSVWTYDGMLTNVIKSIIHTDSLFIIAKVYLLYSIIIGILGSLAFIGLFYSLVSHLLKKEFSLKFLSICSNWGQYTLGIYILQTIILETLLAKYILLDNIGFLLFDLIVSPTISLLVLIICVTIIKIIRKQAFLDFLLLGNFSRYNKKQNYKQ